jgi:ATP:ADP antiporter, AAA family
VNVGSATRLAMPIAALMIAHQVAGKAVRDATFLGAWPVSRLPLMVMGTAVVVIAAVPVYSWLLERFGPRAVVSIGFLISAVGHAVEWQFSDGGPVIALIVYLHIAGLSVLLLSGFWSVLSELVDPSTAKASYGRIAAAGTIGGLAGGLAVAQIARSMPGANALVMLAILHTLCGFGVALLGSFRRPMPSTAASSSTRGRLFEAGLLTNAPHLRTLGLIVTLGTAAAAVADYLLKEHAVLRIQTSAGLLEFFAGFYLVVQVATFLAQFAVGPAVRRIGLGRTISTLPAGVGAMGVLGLLYGSFPVFVAVRAIESVLRGSFFRSAYELIFVPMAPAEKHRTKTFLDVTCDRLGDAVGAGIVQGMLLLGSAYLTTELLGVIIAMAGWSLYLANRLDALYLGVVERRLTAHGDAASVVVGSETGWTVLDLVPPDRPARTATTEVVRKPPVIDDPTLQRLWDLRSGQRSRVERALAKVDRPDSLEIAQIVQLLAWDDLVASARTVLERSAASHVGLLTDTLLDPDADFAIRRRLPRILGTLSDPRALEGLVSGLDDTRFEVRYQCSRAIRRMLAKHPSRSVDGTRILAVVERELAVPPQVWHGHRLIDSVEGDDDSLGEPDSTQEQRNVEHVFSLLSTVLPPEPLSVALHGIRSSDPSLRGVAIEYLESVLPQPIWTRLWVLLDAGATPSDAGAHARSDPQPPTTPR